MPAVNFTSFSQFFFTKYIIFEYNNLCKNAKVRF